MDLKKLIKIINIVYIVFITYEYYNTITSRRRWWVRPVNLTRDNYGFFNRGFINIKENDPEHFKRATQMSVDHFQLLLSLIKINIEKHSQRKPISAECRYSMLYSSTRECFKSRYNCTFFSTICFQKYASTIAPNLVPFYFFVFFFVFSA